MKHAKQLFCALLILIILGCGGAPAPNRDPVYPVSGKVTYKGQPVVAADITFIADAVNRSAFGRTDEKGEYRLSTFGAFDGAVAGKQTVIISKTGVASTGNEAPIDSPDYVPPGYEKVKPPATPAEREIPAKYASPQTSGLIAIVNSDGAPNVIDFELKD